MREAGFVLIVSLIIAILMATLAGLAFLQVNRQWNLATALESQLHSEVLAENGVEYARHLLPYLEINDLLRGSDGVWCDMQAFEWRNPMSLDIAQRIKLDSWTPQCDDGLLLPASSGPGNTEASSFFVRFSNNPEEEPFSDIDHILIARSMGIVPEKLSTVFAPEIKNCVTVLEVRLRQEVLFLLPSPLLIFGDGGDFTFEGTDFVVDGGSQCAISVVGLSSSGMENDVMDALSAEQLPSIRGRGEDGSVEDGSEKYASAYYSRLFEVSFWRHFVSHIPYFADPFPPSQQENGFYFLPEGGVLEGTYFGLLVAQGDLLLTRSARIFGLLVHLGNGQLSVTDQTEVTGGIWLSNLEFSGDQLESHDVSLELSGSCRITYEPETIRTALRALPATQLGWRMIFPEMNSE